ncbi:Arm DNA-binding domain-containing protein [Deefgea salmonis]|uniref:Arm DNA-binding domain-containing protein n=1 Tax=Deefgea salmonis TaxID=2875502 RepID=A0ABS8BKY5_9NEIS|nr:Arm DNA-binding domain-containing protein [Deefgea salmonis]MCB5196383.1 Arm DNA-binding domain-containing protein [Deefgea salmonis]
MGAGHRNRGISMPRAKIEKTAKTCNLLTPLEIKNAKLPEGKAETALNDGGGLYLIITENRKRWRYRYGLNGKMFKQWLGEYPKVTLAQARKLRNDSLSKVEEGKDPRIEKQVAKIAAQYSIANTFAAYTEKYVLKS